MAIQEIGLDIDLSMGTFINTVYRDQKLRLTEQGLDVEGNVIYASSGSWESNPILIRDKFASFKGVASKMNSSAGSEYQIYWSTSDDGFQWTAYEQVQEQPAVPKAQAKYAKVKIEITAGQQESTFYIDNFMEKGKYSNPYIESDSGVLSLKTKYSLKMDQKAVTSTGMVFEQKVERAKFKKIDQIRVEKG
ncbi:hypothetical protein SAMN05720606_10889 [Paenibacillus polysaccharolyticus]|uniref:F5/8 type C domain-containing protein n=1 Tax=Paenibacillus polysaccharolyticus TaxID=582692 RepID=A0A1G5I7D0_9BACL|nr:hypothetical protein [Paenibacillus polysaccharolyticus]SCY72036.1 hypothetical protein SAMN05720606_10889 [Paenibacillus polysaccharolyticus]